jgi:uncharacterized protein
MVKVKEKLELLPGVYAVCRMDKDALIPGWATAGRLCSITRTAEELSVVCPDADVPGGVKQEGGWKALMVEGPLDFSTTGVLASLTFPLAREGVSVFAISTYNTDYLLVKQEQLHQALRALRSEGHAVVDNSSEGAAAERAKPGPIVRKE